MCRRALPRWLTRQPRRRINLRHRQSQLRQQKQRIIAEPSRPAFRKQNPPLHSSLRGCHHFALARQLPQRSGAPRAPPPRPRPSAAAAPRLRSSWSVSSPDSAIPICAARPSSTAPVSSCKPRRPHPRPAAQRHGLQPRASPHSPTPLAQGANNGDRFPAAHLPPGKNSPSSSGAAISPAPRQRLDLHPAPRAASAPPPPGSKVAELARDSLVATCRIMLAIPRPRRPPESPPPRGHRCIIACLYRRPPPRWPGPVCSLPSHGRAPLSIQRDTLAPAATHPAPIKSLNSARQPRRSRMIGFSSSGRQRHLRCRQFSLAQSQCVLQNSSPEGQVTVSVLGLSSSWG